MTEIKGKNELTDSQIRSLRSMLPENCALSAIQWHRYNGELPEGLSDYDLLERLIDEAREIQGGNIDLITRHLCSQAIALGVIFEKTMVQAAASKNTMQFEAYMRMALKAQNQSRMAFESLANMIKPKEPTIIKQQNNAVNQIVTNGLENKKVSNELLSSEMNYAPMDISGATSTIKENSSVEAMAKLCRPKNEGR